MCGGVVEFLYFVVERDRSDASDSRNTSAEHENHSEFTDGVRET
jgi:hypothetical protein